MGHPIIIGSAVRCADGKLGSVGGLLINPNRNHVDYVILNPGLLGGREYFVPSARVQRAAAGELALPGTWEELDDLPRPAIWTEQGTVQDNLSDLCMARAHTPVYAPDGSLLGQFHGAVVDGDFQVAEIMLEQAPNEAIPVASVARYNSQGDGITVRLERQAGA